MAIALVDSVSNDGNGRVVECRVAIGNLDGTTKACTIVVLRLESLIMTTAPARNHPAKAFIAFASNALLVTCVGTSPKIKQGGTNGDKRCLLSYFWRSRRRLVTTIIFSFQNSKRMKENKSSNRNASPTYT